MLNSKIWASKRRRLGVRPRRRRRRSAIHVGAEDDQHGEAGEALPINASNSEVNDRPRSPQAPGLAGSGGT